MTMRLKDYNNNELDELTKEELKKLLLEESVATDNERRAELRGMIESGEHNVMATVIITAVAVALVTVFICSHTMGGTKVFNGQKIRGYYPIVMTERCEYEHNNGYYYGDREVSRTFCKDWADKECNRLYSNLGEIEKRYKCSAIYSDAGL
jgi:hypothetical protein